MLQKKPKQRYFAKHTNIIHQLISSALSMSMTYSQFPPKYYTYKQSTLRRQMNPEFFLGGKNGKCFSLAQPIEQKLYFSSFEDDAFASVVCRGNSLHTQYCKRRNFFAALFTWKIGIKGEDQLYSSLSLL